MLSLAACVTSGQPAASAQSAFPDAEKGKHHTAEFDNGANRGLPAMIVTDEEAPQVIYRRGSRDTVLPAPEQMSVAPDNNKQNVETLVTRKLRNLRRDLTDIEDVLAREQDRLLSLQRKCDADASEYYGIVASVNTELQSGTTPGNPILVEKWNRAQDRLDALSQKAGYLSTLAGDITDDAKRAQYLQENIRATYNLSGAVKEDHQNLRQLEDKVNATIVGINRLLTAANDDINRRNAYLRTERGNMQTLSLSIANGELYGQSLTNSLYQKVVDSGDGLATPPAASRSSAPMPLAKAVPGAPAAARDGGNIRPASFSARRPLVVIRFDRSSVDYQQPLYTAVNQALQKYPGAKFDLVAVSAGQGNPAEIALASTEARKNGEDVVRSLMQMGLPMERLRLNAATSNGVRNSEVHVYLQ